MIIEVKDHYFAFEGHFLLIIMVMVVVDRNFIKIMVLVLDPVQNQYLLVGTFVIMDRLEQYFMAVVKMMILAMEHCNFIIIDQYLQVGIKVAINLYFVEEILVAIGQCLPVEIFVITISQYLPVEIITITKDQNLMVVFKILVIVRGLTDKKISVMNRDSVFKMNFVVTSPSQCQCSVTKRFYSDHLLYPH